MTPEELEDELRRREPALFAFSYRAAMAVIRAALEERDRKWAEAVLPVGECIECGEAFVDYLEGVACKNGGCSALRALLSEAARSAPAPSSPGTD